VASVCRSLDIDVTVVETAAIPLSRVLGASLGGHLADLHRDTGVRILCGTSVVGLHGRDAVESVTLSSGETVETDLILACVGSRPATDWLESSGLSLRNGVLADHRCVVDAEAGIVAAGDVASWHNPLYGRRMRVEHWANAIEQGGFAARALLGTAAESGLSSVPYFWSEQLGSRLQSVGSAQGHDEVAVLEHDGDTMVVAYRRDERLVAVAGIHAGSRVLGYRAKIESRIPFRSVLDDRVASRA
jgi:NADPH-dependent 2,4-dienoyl-CoA reductase/sulfur reductase-like enzyme